LDFIATKKAIRKRLEASQHKEAAEVEERQPGTAQEAKECIDVSDLLTDDAIAEFKVASRSYCLQTDTGEVWIVPRRTSKNRIEVTPEQLRDDPVGVRRRVAMMHEAQRLFGRKFVVAMGR